MVRRMSSASRGVMALALCAWGCVVAGPSSAKGWEPAAWRLELAGREESDLFPGSAFDSADRGLEALGELAVARRLGAPAKLELALRSGGALWQRQSQADHVWFGGQSEVRIGSTRLRLEGEWSPEKLKIPAALDGGTYEERQVRFAVRQALPHALRARAEARLERDDFVPGLDARDATTREGFLQLGGSSVTGLSWRAGFLLGATAARGDKYSHRDRDASFGASFERGLWRSDADVTSGTRRYTRATVDDSNFRRRDQELEVVVAVQRALTSQWTAQLRGTWLDQTSSRAGRTYDTQSLRLALLWTAPR